MSLFKIEKPSRDKEKAIQSVREIDAQIDRIGLKISAKLKTRLKINSLKKKIPYADIIISLIEKYLEEEDRKEAK